MLKSCVCKREDNEKKKKRKSSVVVIVPSSKTRHCEFHSVYVSFLLCVWVLVVKCIHNHNCSTQLLPSSVIHPFLFPHLPLLLLSLCSGGIANVLENWRHPQKEGLSCAYWSCWKWLKRDLCWEGWDCYHCIWFITQSLCGGGPVAAVRKPQIPGALSTHRTCARVETEVHPAPALVTIPTLAHTCSHHLSSIVREFGVHDCLLYIHCANVSSLTENYFVFKPSKLHSYTRLCKLFFCFTSFFGDKLLFNLQIYRDYLSVKQWRWCCSLSLNFLLMKS